jgi:putative Mg2+ transporter-C (MgtC) family protein
MSMPLDPGWQDICIRLLLTMIAGATIGFNRGARGHAAGFRTTILVGLAAAVAMIQANLLLTLDGKTPASFAEMDLMRLPLGILTGVGFIGGGAILKRGDLVKGITTAATLWVMTVIGLCFGGDQLGLGVAATLLAVFTLWALRWVDMRIPREHRAMLTIVADAGGSPISDLPVLVAPLRYHANFRRQGLSRDPGSSGGPEQAEYAFEVSWRRPEQSDPPLDLLRAVSARYPITLFELTSENSR